MTSPKGETLLSRKVIERIRSPRWGGWARKTHGDAFTGRGEPDIDGCLAGRCLKIELKMPGHTPTDAQFAALRRWAAAGALAGWVTSVAELDALLEHAGDTSWVNDQLAAGVGATVIDL